MRRSIGVRLFRTASQNLKDTNNDSEIVRQNKAITTHMRSGDVSGAERVFSDMVCLTIVSFNAMLSGYLSNHCFTKARQLFDEMPKRNLVSWNIMVSGFARNNDLKAARELFERMPERNVVSWTALLSGYAQVGLVSEARSVFEAMPVKNVVSWTALLSCYARMGLVSEARMIFEAMPVKNVVSWTALLSGYARMGLVFEARMIFEAMPVKNDFSWNCLLSAYVQSGLLDEARGLFKSRPARSWDVVSWNTMISGYAQIGDVKQAESIFVSMGNRNSISWAAMIAAYAQNGLPREALGTFVEMQRCGEMLDQSAYACAISACAQIGALRLGKQLHGQMVKFGIEKGSYFANALLLMYYKCGCIEEAYDVFRKMGNYKDIVSWNTMISGYAQIGDVERAKSMFVLMGKRDSISWTAMIAAYAQNGHAEEALGTFVEMQRCGERLDRSAFTCALRACANIGALEPGKQLHGQMVKSGFEKGCYFANALLVMYSKCGCIGEAYAVFQKMGNYKDIVSWNAMISGFAWHGLGREALAEFDSMMAARIVPDEITMGGVLLACSRTGLVETGTEYFNSMQHKYGITPVLKHYNCMIDLLGQAGRLDEARDLIKNMPFEPDGVTWAALLSASRIHGNTKLGEKAAKKV